MCRGRYIDYAAKSVLLDIIMKKIIFYSQLILLLLYLPALSLFYNVL